MFFLRSKCILPYKALLTFDAFTSRIKHEIKPKKTQKTPSDQDSLNKIFKNTCTYIFDQIYNFEQKYTALFPTSFALSRPHLH